MAWSFPGKLVASGIAILISVVFGSSLVSASPSQINTIVCDGTASTAQLTVLEPETGVVVNSAGVVVSGEVWDITQIQVLIDDAPSQIVPIAVHQESFEVTISVPLGTHVITLVGVDICQVENPEQQLIVTYEPASTGGQDDQGENQDGQGGDDRRSSDEDTQAEIDDEPIKRASFLQRTLQPLTEQLNEMFLGLLLALDVIPNPNSSGRPSIVVSILRFILVSAGLLAIIYPQIRQIFHYYRGSGAVGRLRPRVRGLLRVGGVALVIIGLFLA